MDPGPAPAGPRPQFFAHLDVLARAAEFRPDRPRGSDHPRIPGATYPVDYGHLAGTTGGDGGGVDVFRGTTGAGVVAAALTADPVKHDVEVKVLIGCTPAEVAAVEHFLNTVLRIGGLVVRRDRVLEREPPPVDGC